jgi:DNA-binding NarL/FixJ family response regulator
MINVVIADDVPILRQGLKAVLEQDSEIKVTGMAQDGIEAFRICGEKNPDVVLMDMKMPVYDGETGTRRIKESYPHIKVLVLTTFDDEETVSKAMSGGADGYILKEMDNDRIIQSVKSVYSGVNVFGGNVYSCIRKKLAVHHEVQKDIPLTERERDIIVLIAEGYDNKEISSKLYLAEGTVRNNISRMLEKLSLKDRTQLAVFAIKNNLV